MTILDKYADGTDPYGPVIESLRNFLRNTGLTDESSGGALIFFTKKEHRGNELMVKVFPFEKNSALFVEAKKSLSEQQRADMLAIINREKKYNLFSHCDNFKNNNNSDLHFSTHVEKNNVIEYSDDGITLYNKPSQSWQEFYEDMMAGKVEKNTYEQLLFPSGCKEISYIPLPVLSTPFIFLVVDSSVVKGNRDDLLRLLYFRSRDTVSKYLYSRIIDGLSEYLEKYGASITEKDLIQQFVNELCNVLLPVSYSINDGEEQLYYTGWPLSSGSVYELKLLADGESRAKYNVVFKLTSFSYADVENTKNTKWEMFHTFDIYKANVRQSSLLISKLFNLIHKYWVQIKTAEERAYRTVSVAIDNINIAALEWQVENIKHRFELIQEQVRKPKNQLKIEGDVVTLTVSDIPVINQQRYRGKAQIAGFRYLQYILEKANKNKNQANVSAEELYEKIRVTRRVRVPHDKVALQNELNHLSDELTKDVCAFVHGCQKEIAECISRNEPLNNEKFNEELDYTLQLHASLSGSRAYSRAYENKVTYANRSFIEFINDMEKLKEIYDGGDEHETAKIVSYRESNKEKVRSHLAGWNKARHAYEDDGIRSFVYDCFEAMLRIIEGIKDSSSEEKLAACEHFIKNLQEARLVQIDKIAPAGSRSYIYDQRSYIEHFIKWHF